MICWFVGTAWLAVWFVFRDPRFDYRWLAVGALLPDAVDLVLNGVFGWRPLHSITAAIAVLVVVMLATIGRRFVRKRLLAIPIGMFLHLVFDGAFNSTRVFWWPFTGTGFPAGRIPSVDRLPGGLALEAIGVVLVWWCVKRGGLDLPGPRARFARTGELDLGGVDPSDRQVPTC